MKKIIFTMLLFTFSSNILLAQNLVPIDNESSVALALRILDQP
jgi:hypothetical protein